MKEKIILVGKSASGKDYFLEKFNRKKAVKITTRPIRNGEIPNKDYVFISNAKFVDMVVSKEIVIHQKFIINNNVWWYGYTSEQLNNSEIFIMTPEEIKMLSKSVRNDFYVVYIKSSFITRYRRLKRRLDGNDSILRRMFSDYLQFFGFRNYDGVINN